MKRLMRVVVGIALAVIVALGVLAGIRAADEAKSVRTFREYAGEFEKEKDAAWTQHGACDVSRQLAECGIQEVYSTEKYVYFEFEKRVLGMFPQGLVYTECIDELPAWYITKPVTGNWYYYRVCS